MAEEKKSNESMLVFPSNLRDEAYKDRPTIQFSCQPKDEKTVNIFLPCPGGISFGDSGEYSTISTMTPAGIGLSALEKISTAAGTASVDPESVKRSATQMIDDLKKMAKTAAGRENLTQDTAAVLAAVSPGDLGQQIAFRNKVIMDPRINTSFNGNGIRTFSFQFKMIAMSQEESVTVKDIYNEFRKNMYAKLTESKISLIYPPVWKIKFLKGVSKRENDYIPKIHTCYLTDVSTVFNSENNSWRVDTAPLSVDISISFQETKVLTREEIETLIGPNPDRTGAGKVGFLNSLQGNFKKSVNKKLDSLKNEVRDIFRF